MIFDGASRYKSKVITMETQFATKSAMVNADEREEPYRKSCSTSSLGCGQRMPAKEGVMLGVPQLKDYPLQSCVGLVEHIPDYGTALTSLH